MKIARVEIAPFEPRFLGDGYVMSFVRQTVLHARLVRLTLADGAVGYGEAVFRPIFPAEELRTAEDAVLPRLAGADMRGLNALLAEWRAQKILRGLAFGVETALLDIRGRTRGVPLSQLLGGPASGEIATYASLSSEAPAAMAAAIVPTRPYPVIQAKLGIDDIETDLERVRVVLDLMARDQLLLADFNGALTLDEALAALPRVSDPRLMWEEPCTSLDDNTEVARSIAAPVMFDQCLRDLDAYARVLDERAAAAVAIKPASLGSLILARAAREMCAGFGMRMRIDGPWSGQIGAVAALHLALGAPPELLISSADLTEPLDTDRSLVPGRPGVAGIDGTPGLGVIPPSVREADWVEIAR